MLRIGQAVVTDPLTERSGGYVLVAASPSVTAAEARHLELTPQVTDHLHLASSPGPFFSFHRLPSGGWAVARRFVAGRRRGEYNRVVVHTLVIDGEVLGALGDDPWLLLTRCQLRGPGGTQSFAELASVVGAEGLAELADLELVPPGDAAAERLELIRRRRELLAGSWEDLEQRLAAALAGLAAGRPVLFPQDALSVQWMALAYSSLPPADRREVAWTTHLAAAAGDLYQLACTPDPTSDRRELAQPERWLLAGSESPPEERAGDAAALARAVLTESVDLAALERGLSAHHLRLRGDRGAVRRFLAWIERGGADFDAGFAEVAGLRSFLADLAPGGAAESADPWLEPGNFLAAAVATIDRQLQGGAEAEPLIEDVHECLREGGWNRWLLSAEAVAAAAPRLARRVSADAPEIAVSLGLRDLGEANKEDRAAREVLASVLLARQSPGDGSAGQPAGRRLRVGLLARLTRSLALAGSPYAIEVAERLADEDGFGAGIAALHVRESDLPAIHLLLRTAQQRGEHAAAGQLVAGHLLPLWVRRPAPPEVAPGGLTDYAFEVLRAVPAAVAEAMCHGGDELYDRLATELRRWAREHRPEAAAVADSLIAGSGPADPLAIAAGESDPAAGGDPWRSREAVRGLAAALAAAGTTVAGWWPFALAEATLDDRGELASFLRGVTLSRVEAAPRVHRTLAAFRAASREGRLSPAHGALLFALGGGLAVAADEVVAVLAELNAAPGRELLQWGPTVRDVAAHLAEGGAGSQSSTLCANWWQAFRLRDREQVPVDLLPMLAALEPGDGRRVVQRWVDEVPRLLTEPGGAELIARLRDLAAGDDDLRFAVEAGAVVASVREARLSLAEAAAQLEALAWTTSAPAERLSEELPRLLPRDAAGRAAALLDLLLAAGPSPGVKRALERELAPVLRRAGQQLPGILPPFDRLARRGLVLLRVAAALGRLGAEDRGAAESFLRAAHRAGRPDAMAALLHEAQDARQDLVSALADGDRSLLEVIAASREGDAAALYLAPFRGPASRALASAQALR